jgi:fatty acid desaturase
MSEASAKASKSKRVADRSAFVTLLIAVFGVWGLITGHPVIHPAWGFVGLVAGITAGAAYRSASRWERIAHREVMNWRKP